MYRVWILTCVLGGLACSTSGGAGQSARLYAPGYYIAVTAARDYEGAIRVRGASNLPVGAKISLEVEELTSDSGRKPVSTNMCAEVDHERSFNAELPVAKDVYRKKSLVVDAIFISNQCAQAPEVIQVVGRHGELLGNDGHPVTMNEVERGETPGMQRNPQLFQVSGWYLASPRSQELTELSTGISSGTASYTYDGNGMRVVKSVTRARKPRTRRKL